MPKPETQMTPKARTRDLIVKEVPGEVVVYDLKREKAHCLNQTAALVWKRCNGRRTVADLVRTLEKDLDAPVDEHIVQLALYQLGRNHLLSTSLDQAPWRAGIPRRDLVKKLGWAALVTLPLVTSIIAPSAASAATCIADATCTSIAEVGLCCCTVRKLCRQTGATFHCNGADC